MKVNIDFSEWLVKELNKREWSNSELARRAGVVPSYVSMVISLGRQPGLGFCKKVANALGVSEDEVVRAAGLISGPAVVSELSEEELKVLYSYRKLDTIRKKEIVAILDVLITIQGSNGET